MDYSKITIPFIPDNVIATKANAFREKYRPRQSSPFDVLGTAEFDLKIQIIPVPGLESPCNTNAYITADWNYIYIDKKQYEDERWDKRTNFSVAHEIGHLVLHKSLYESLKIKELEDFYRFHEQFSNAAYSRIETQANMFAAKLLVPAEELRAEVQKMIKAAKAGKIASTEIKGLLCNKFQVSDDVIFWRLVTEKIPVDDQLLEDFA